MFWLHHIGCILGCISYITFLSIHENCVWNQCGIVFHNSSVYLNFFFEAVQQWKNQLAAWWSKMSVRKFLHGLMICCKPKIFHGCFEVSLFCWTLDYGILSYFCIFMNTYCNIYKYVIFSYLHCGPVIKHHFSIKFLCLFLKWGKNLIYTEISTCASYWLFPLLWPKAYLQLWLCLQWCIAECVRRYFVNLCTPT